MRADMPALPVDLARLKLSMFAKEAWYYDVPFMHVTFFIKPMLVDEQSMNVTVGTVARKKRLIPSVRSRTVQF